MPTSKHSGGPEPGHEDLLTRNQSVRQRDAPRDDITSGFDFPSTSTGAPHPRLTMHQGPSEPSCQDPGPVSPGRQPNASEVLTPSLSPRKRSFDQFSSGDRSDDPDDGNAGSGETPVKNRLGAMALKSAILRQSTHRPQDPHPIDPNFVPFDSYSYNMASKPSVPPPPKPSLPHSQACDRCRIRKVRCDARRPRCTACEKHARTLGVPVEEISCQYRVGPGSTSHTEDAQRIAELEQRVALLERFISQQDEVSWRAFQQDRSGGSSPSVTSQLPGVITDPGGVSTSTSNSTSPSPQDHAVNLIGMPFNPHLSGTPPGHRDTLSSSTTTFSGLSEAPQSDQPTPYSDAFLSEIEQMVWTDPASPVPARVGGLHSAPAFSYLPTQQAYAEALRSLAPSTSRAEQSAESEDPHGQGSEGRDGERSQ